MLFGLIMGKVDFSTSLRQLESAIGALEASKSAAAVGQVLRRSAPQPPVYHIRPEELDAECVDAVFQYLNNALGNIWGEVQRYRHKCNFKLKFVTFGYIQADSI